MSGGTCAGMAAAAAELVNVLARLEAEERDAAAELETVLVDFARPLWKIQISGYFDGIEAVIDAREAVSRAASNAAAVLGEAPEAHDAAADTATVRQALAPVVSAAGSLATAVAEALLSVPPSLERSFSLADSDAFAAFLSDRGCRLPAFQEKLLAPLSISTVLLGALEAAAAGGAVGPAGGADAGSAGCLPLQHLRHLAGVVEDARRLVRLQHCCTWKTRKSGPSSSLQGPVHILRAGRRLLRSGKFVKLGRADPKEVHVWLLNDLLIYGTAVGEDDYTIHRCLGTEALEVLPRESSDPEHTLRIRVKPKTLVLVSSDATQAAEWASAFAAAAGGKPSEWVPKGLECRHLGAARMGARQQSMTHDAEADAVAAAAAAVGETAAETAAESRVPNGDAGEAPVGEGGSDGGADARGGAGGAGRADSAAPLPDSDVLDGGGADEVVADGIVFGTIARGWRGDRHPVIVRARLDRLVENVVSPHASLPAAEVRSAFFLTLPFFSTAAEVASAFVRFVGDTSVATRSGGSAGAGYTATRTQLSAALEVLRDWVGSDHGRDDVADVPEVRTAIAELLQRGVRSSVDSEQRAARDLQATLTAVSGGNAWTVDDGATPGGAGTSDSSGKVGLFTKLGNFFGGKKKKSSSFDLSIPTSGKRKALRDHSGVAPRALAMALLDFEVRTRMKIGPRELLYFDGKDKDTSRCTNVLPLLQNFDKMSYWVAEEILHLDFNARQRAEMIETWVAVAHESVQLRNFNAVYAIVTALRSYYIQRLETAWSMLSKSVTERFHALEELTSASNNSRAYRKTCGRAGHLPYIDAVTISLKDLATAKIAVKSDTSALKARDDGATIPFGKWTQIAHVVTNELLRVHTVPFTDVRGDERLLQLIRHGLACDKTAEQLNELSQEANLRENLALEESLEEAGFF